ncbi:hypothetical protein FHETE_2796 [Fusarium heterosporum]|uniref:Uncharacterized protein n=1 Tax=Fusarium heterosporum TaxID=42747 RepID=A0A8H5TUM4_FUSHE|nr:hypothetical protein FHETE_2796 [Fusarium heterosporum]
MKAIVICSPVATRKQSRQGDESPIIDVPMIMQNTWVPAIQQAYRRLDFDLPMGDLLRDPHQRHSLGPLQPKQPKKKAVNPYSPHDASKVTKTVRLLKQVDGQQKRSQVSTDSNGNKLIIIDHGSATRGSSTPTKTDDVNPYYTALNTFSPWKDIPPCDPKLVYTCPQPPSITGMFDQKTYFPYQLDMARHLAYNGVSGLYELGDILGDIHRGTAKPVKIARRATDEHGLEAWRHLLTQDLLQPQDGSHISGKPVALSNGALIWIEDRKGKAIAAEWTFADPREWHFSDKTEQVQEEKPEKKKMQQQRRSYETAETIHHGMKPGCDPMWF